MMKVLYIQDFGDIGGATNSLKELVKKMNNNYNIEPIIITSDYNSVNQYADENNYENYSIKHKQFIVAPSKNIFKKIIKNYFPYILYIYNYIFNLFALKKLEKKINFNEIDFVHTNVIRSQIGFIICKKYGIKHIVHLREFSDLDYNCKPLMKNYINYINKYSTQFIAISNVIKEHWIKKGLDESKIKVIYNGVDIIEKTKKIFSKDKIKMVFCGQICETKGQIQVIEALKLLDEDLLKKIRIDFYGTGEEKYINNLKNYIEKYKLESIISFKGFDKNVREKLQEYDIGFICSKSEAFGRVTVEYMMSRVLVIASDSGANKELITNEVNGLIYEYNNISKLKENIIKAIEILDNRKDIIDNAYNIANKKYTSDMNSKEIYKVYKRLM